MKKQLKKAITFMLAGSMCISMLGCAGNTNTSWGTSAVEMGRYVDRTVLDIDEISILGKLQRLSDESLVYFNSLVGKYVSTDNGDTWNMEEIEGLSELIQNQEECLIVDAAISKEGAILVVCVSAENTENDNVIETEQGNYILFEPDGTQRELAIELPVSVYQRSHTFDENGRLLVSTMDTPIYEINIEDGSTSTFLNASDVIMSVQCQDQRMLCVSHNDIYVYDMEKKTQIEDTVLSDFIKNTYGSLMSSDFLSYNYYAFLGEENVVYIAGKEGLHRHVIGGNSMEQVIDGNLSSLGDPSKYVVSAQMIDNQEFLVQYSDSTKLFKFEYNPNIPTVPANYLTVYSLTDNETIHQAMSAFQTSNPDIYIEYEIGMSEDGLTRDDALKNLSTRFMDGNGPDILVMDDMPLDSYIDKGILLDISEPIRQIDNESGLLTNILEPFYEENSLYVVPVEFQLPVIATDKNVKTEIANFTEIADYIEILRKECPEKDILGVYLASDVMNKFSKVCAPSWKNENGDINEEKIKEFLSDSKRIYEAQMNGLQEKSVFSNDLFTDLLNDVEYASGYELLMSGSVASIKDFSFAMSVQRVSGFENTEVNIMNGQSSNVYFPKTMIGINAATKNQDGALSFLQALLGNEVQTQLHAGFPVNHAALEECTIIDKKYVSGDGSYMTAGVTNEEGNSITWNIYWPDENQIQTLKNWITQASIPYIQDSVLEEVVSVEGSKYLTGDQDIDTTLEHIMNKIAIYMAE